MPQTIGFIGLGNMGLPMATNLAKAGFQVLAYNRTPKSSLPESLEAVDTPAAAAAPGIVVTMLADDAALEAVCQGARGVLAGLPNGGFHVSMSTISPTTSSRLAEAHAERGQQYVAAPVFGRPERAAAAELWVLVAGPAEAVSRVTPLVEAMSQGQFPLGERPESANVVKLAGNFLITSVLEALGEAYALARKAGIAPSELLDVVNTALFKSPLYETYGRLVAEQRFSPPGFRLRLGLKDVRLLLDTAEAHETPMPLASLVRDQMLTGIARGMGDLDWAALTQVIADNAGCRSDP
jgi:3-hydroxyisobutyrate dehydrogenase-like beta-hydroxyacid dehydrogenase